MAKFTPDPNMKANAEAAVADAFSAMNSELNQYLATGDGRPFDEEVAGVERILKKHGAKPNSAEVRNLVEVARAERAESPS